MKRVFIVVIAVAWASAAWAEAPSCDATRGAFRDALGGFTAAEARVSELRQDKGQAPREARRDVADEAVRRAGRVIDAAARLQQDSCHGFGGKPGEWTEVQRSMNDAIAGFARFAANDEGLPQLPSAPQVANPEPAEKSVGSAALSLWSFLPASLSGSLETAPPRSEAPRLAQADAAEPDPGSPPAACVALMEEPNGDALDQYIENNCDYAVNVRLCFDWQDRKKGNVFQCGTRAIYETKKPIESGFRRKVASTTDPFRWLLNRCNATENPKCVPRTPSP